MISEFDIINAIRRVILEEAPNLIRQALAQQAAENPLPSSLTTAEAAKILRRSERTVRRMKLPRDRLGMIPYAEVVKAQRVLRKPRGSRGDLSTTAA